jgi:hypothetical protein
MGRLKQQGNQTEDGPLATILSMVVGKKNEKRQAA